MNLESFIFEFFFFSKLTILQVEKRLADTNVFLVFFESGEQSAQVGEWPGQRREAESVGEQRLEEYGAVIGLGLKSLDKNSIQIILDFNCFFFFL